MKSYDTIFFIQIALYDHPCISSLCIQQAIRFVSRIYFRNVVTALKILFVVCACRTHTYNTRSDDDYSYNIMGTNIRKFIISYQGPLIWNKLPLSLRQTNRILKFKSALKESTKTLDKWEH